MMKIDGANQHSDALRPVDTASAQDSAHPDAATRSPGDRVVLSGDAKLLNEAIQAARRLPDFRAELVTRMQQKLDSGELGRDPVQVADRMIQRLLEHG